MSSLNSGHFDRTNFIGVWEYVDIYSTVRILVSGGACTVKLDWANEERGNVTDNTDIMASETLTVTGTETFTRTIIAKQLRVSLDNTAHHNDIYLSVFYLDSSNIIKIIDDHGSVVDIGNGSLNTVVSSTGGAGLLSTFSDGAGPALYTALTDSNGALLKKEGGALSVALRDNSGEILSIVNDNLLVHMSDACGFSVATTKDVTGAHKAGSASFLALPVGSYLTDYNLSMLVNLRGAAGGAMAPTGTERLAMKLMEDDVSLAFTFDVSTGINNYNVNTVLNRPVIVYCINCYNDSATTSWVSIFDQSLNNFHPNNATTLMRIPVPAKQTRDIYFPRGIRLDNGLSLIGSSLPTDYDIPFPDNKLFMSGVYSPFTDPVGEYVTPIVPVAPTAGDKWPGITEAVRNQSMKLTYNILATGTKVELAVKYIVGKLYIAWGDGTVTEYNPQSSHIQSHTYNDADTYEIYIVGEFRQFGNPLDLAGIDRLQSVDSFGTLAKIENLDNAFAGAINLQTVTDTLPTTVKSINYMFSGATSNFTGIAGWNVQNVDSARGLFFGCTNFNVNISNWNWASLSDATEMLQSATSFNQPIGNWKMHLLFYADNMLNGATNFNQSLAGWQSRNASLIFATGIFTGSGLSEANYNLSLIGWWEYYGNGPTGLITTQGRYVSVRNVSADVGATGDGKVARANLISILKWSFNDATV